MEREPREVNITKLELLGFDDVNQSFSIAVTASKGTYIRSLAHDIGQALGCGAVLTSLRRTYACGFDESECVTLEWLEEHAASLDSAVIPVENALKHFPHVRVSRMQSKRFSNGGEARHRKAAVVKGQRHFPRLFRHGGVPWAR